MKHTVQDLFSALLLKADEDRKTNAGKLSIVQNVLRTNTEPAVVYVGILHDNTVITAYHPVSGDQYMIGSRLDVVRLPSHRYGMDFINGVGTINGIPYQYTQVTIPNEMISCENKTFLLFLFGAMDVYSNMILPHDD